MGKGHYIRLKKITALIFTMMVCSIIFVYFFISWLRGDYSWEEMELEYIGEIRFCEPFDDESKMLSQIAADGRYISCANEQEEYGVFQIRKEEDWEYICHVFKPEEIDMQLDFSSYYLVGIRVRISNFQYVNEEWMLDSHWPYTRIKENAESFKKGTLHVYRMPENIRSRDNLE